MRLDGGEAKRVTDAREGVSNFQFTKDGKSIVYTSGRSERRAALRAHDRRSLAGDVPRATQLDASCDGHRQLAVRRPMARQIYFVTPDSIDRDDRARNDKQFTREAARSGSRRSQSLWVVRRRREAGKPAHHDTTTVSPMSRSRPTASGSGSTACRRVAMSAAISSRTTTPICICSTSRAANIERLTKNDIISEGSVSFSPDSKTIAFSAPDDFKFMHNEKIYVRPRRSAERTVEEDRRQLSTRRARRRPWRRRW